MYHLTSDKTNLLHYSTKGCWKLFPLSNLEHYSNLLVKHFSVINFPGICGNGTLDISPRESFNMRLIFGMTFYEEKDMWVFAIVNLVSVVVAV